MEGTELMELATYSQNKYREEMRQKRREGQSTSVLDGASTEEKTSIISNVSKAITKDEGLKGSALTRNIENAVFAKSVTKEDLAKMLDSGQIDFSEEQREYLIGGMV